MLSLDSETTGLDFTFGSAPFLVTFCRENGTNIWFEWVVNPLDRRVEASADDLEEIQQLVDDAPAIVGQNLKFDLHALQVVYGGRFSWDWSKLHDTLIAGHLLASNQPHDLTSMAVVYLRANIRPYEDKLKVAVDEARRLARGRYPDWRIAKEGLPEMPSAKGTPWKYDCWLPRAIAEEENYPKDHSWWTVCSDYANTDSACTLRLWKEQERLLKEMDLWEIYLCRLKLLPIAYDMERRGVTINKRRLDELLVKYSDESASAARVCTNIARDFNCQLKLPKAGNNRSLRECIFNHMGIQANKWSKKTGEPALDKQVLDYLEKQLPAHSKKLAFVRALGRKRRCDTAVAYLEGYKRFWRQLRGDWYVLHPNLNITGSATLRWSSSNPNEQNLSKQEGFNLRAILGPAPGREWWSLDAQNVELRIPAFEAGEKDMVYVFEHPEEPPYYGSYHLLIADLLHPKKFKQHGKNFKHVFESTWYQWVKNGNFAILYGAQKATADATYHVDGAFERIRERFPRIAKLAEKQMNLANSLGYVETIPDRSIGAKRGYPILCDRSENGGTNPTEPLNYHVQSTAMWWMGKAMIRCFDYLNELSSNGQRFHIVLQIHDELVFDMPKRIHGGTKLNLPVVMALKELMEKGGSDIGVPTPVAMKYHDKSWDVGEPVKDSEVRTGAACKSTALA